MTEDKEEVYSDIRKLAEDSAKLMFQLFKDRVLRFDINRTLEINTFLLNYFIVQNYFLAFDLQEDFISQRTEDESLDCSNFRQYVERLHGIFILIPMKYEVEKAYTKGQTDKIINQMDVYGELINNFFYSHENLTNVKIDKILEFLEGYTISHRFFPNLDFDPEFNEILNSDAFNQLFYITYPKEYFYENNIQRHKFPLDEALAKEYAKAMKDWEKKLFQFNPELKLYQNFLRKAVNYIPVPDFGSKELMYEVIEKLKQYYCFRVKSLSPEIHSYLDCFQVLFEFAEGKMYKKFSWNFLHKKLESVSDEEIVDVFLNRFCLSKTYEKFYESYQDFSPHDFIKNYNRYIKYACYSYMGSVYTGALLIWRAMKKYLEELQKTDEFREMKGSLLENWGLRQIKDVGFDVEKIILRNIDIEQPESYYLMKKQVKSFDKEPLEFEVKFVKQQRKYPFHEIDLVFRFEDELYFVECKGRALQSSETKKYYKWAKNFDSTYKILQRKIENLGYCLEKGEIMHPFFDDVKSMIPIVLQTEGMFLRYCTFTPDEFSGFLKFVKEG